MKKTTMIRSSVVWNKKESLFYNLHCSVIYKLWFFFIVGLEIALYEIPQMQSGALSTSNRQATET